MLETNLLHRWCRPISDTGPYLRPFVVRGGLATGGAFIVGVNPATAISAADEIDFERYASSLADVDQFLPIYNNVRARHGKSSISRTRSGMDEASRWLMSKGFRTIVDTNISPYPTKNEREWEQLSPEEKALWVFPEVVALFQPSLVLLHGKAAYQHFCGVYAPGLLQAESFRDVVENHPRLGLVKWPTGGAAEVYVCPHIRFFGKQDGGARFAPLRASLAAYDPSHVNHLAVALSD